MTLLPPAFSYLDPSFRRATGKRAGDRRWQFQALRVTNWEWEIVGKQTVEWTNWEKQGAPNHQSFWEVYGLPMECEMGESQPFYVDTG